MGHNESKEGCFDLIPDEPPCNKESLKWKQVKIEVLEVGDHICWWCKVEDKTILQTPYYRHALVAEISKDILTVIGWKFRSDGRTKKYKPEIVQEDIDFTDVNTIHRTTYEKKCYKIEEVLDRARKHIGDMDYHVVYNYARAFPRFCKTGYGGVTFSPPEERPSNMFKTNITNINRGDHICFFNKIYYKHAIVKEEWSNGEITIISWTLYPKREIIQEKVKFPEKCTVYKVLYSNSVRKSEEEVLTRAESRIGETSYHVMTNYARAFPRWCVQGYGGIFTK